MESTAASPDQATTRYSWYVLFVLFLANALNSADRSIVNILVEPIRNEFGFSDLQIGIVSGLGFAIFYAAFGIAIARAADRSSRRNLLAAGIAIWSVMTAFTGAARGFGTMLLARIGVGVGEASCYPTAFPLISDYFTPEKRPRAIALFQVGIYVGFILGAVIAGQVAEKFGWRSAFYALGLPGLAVALLVLLTVREPTRGMSEGITLPISGNKGTLGDMLRLLVSDRRFLLLVCGAACLATVSAVMANWGSAFLMRAHGIGQAEVGVIAGPVIGMGGIIGTISGGLLGTFLAKRGGAERAPMLVPLIATLPAVPFLLLFIFAPTLPAVLLGGGVAAFLVGMHMGPTVATALSLIPPHNRGLASSLIVLGQLLVGFGIGPVITGLISTVLENGGSDPGEALRQGLLVAPVAAVLAFLCFFAGYRAIAPGAALQAIAPASVSA